MIFVAVGTHPDGFERLIRHIDAIAPKIKEKIIVQRGFTNYKPKNAESFDFKPSLDPYYKKARIIVSHSATSLLEVILKFNKPVITVPRQKKFKEHINDHQKEFAEFFSIKAEIPAIYKISDLTPELLKNTKKAKVDPKNLKKLQDKFINLFDLIEKQK